MAITVIALVVVIKPAVMTQVTVIVVVVVVVAPFVRIAIITMPGVAITVVIASIVVDRAVIQIRLYEPSVVLAVSKCGGCPSHC